MMKKQPIVVFVGPVGVGKTTQALLLTNYLQKKKFKTKFVYINTYYPMLLNFVKKNLIYVSDRNTELSLFLLRKIMKLIISIDLGIILIKYIFKLLVPSIIHRWSLIIFEEFFVGILINYLWLFKRNIIGRKTLNVTWMILSRLCFSNPKYIIILIASPNIVKIRQVKRDVVEKRDSYLVFQYRMFERLENFLKDNSNIKIKKIIADKSIRSVFKEVVRETFNFINI